MKCACLLLMFVGLACNGFAQNTWNARRDSMLLQIRGLKEDTMKVQALLAVGMLYDGSQPDSARYYYKALGDLSEKLQYNRGRVTALNMTAGILCKQNKADEAISLDLQALAIAKKSNNRRLLGRSYINLAIPYKVKGDYQTALDNYLKAGAIATELKDSLTLASLAINLTTLYKTLKQYPKAAASGLRGVQLSKELKNLKLVNAALVNLSSVLIEQAKYDTAMVVLKDSKLLSEQLNDKSSASYALINMGVIYVQLNRYALLKGNAEELMTLSEKLGNKEGISNAMQQLYSYYFYQKDYKKAREYVSKALQYNKDNQLVFLMAPTYHQLSLIELLEGDFANFKLHADMSDSIEQELKSKEIIKNTQELDAKYTLTARQAEIAALNKEKVASATIIRQRNLLNLVLLTGLLVMAAAGWLLYRNQQQKRKLLEAGSLVQQQQIKELEKQKQLLAADAVLQGQEEERSRLARELHDGLGGILSSAKYAFNNMKNNYIITEEGAAAFDRSMNMLDKSISELRLVSHNMMPEALLSFGLDTALKDYCNSINQTGAVALTYQSFGLTDETIPKATASVVYRIVQELVNNIMKHAKAGTALVQLVKKENALSITVEDDGRGFDKTMLRDNDGIGLKNLQNRVAYLKGNMDVHAEKGKGVSVTIEIPLVAG